MSENPEEMHPHHGGASSLGVEEMAAEVAVDQQHDLRRRQWTDREDYKAGHHEVEPGKQWHFRQRHAWGTHAENSCDDVDRCADAAKTGDQKSQRPKIRAMAQRESLRSERCVSEPPNVG